MTTSLSLGYSPCPNDTFMFHALVHGLVPCDQMDFKVRMEDVETLNQLALQQTLDLTKVSFHALGHLRKDYLLLRSGSALGRGCGPLVVSRKFQSMDDLRGRTIALPGRLTTAGLLLRLHAPHLDKFLIMPFDRIMAAVVGGEADAGVIIHESRFTYQQYGLHQLLDLGQWWEKDSGHPIPLGGILARRSLDHGLSGAVEQALRESISFARNHPQTVADYIRAHAQELSDEVTRQHIALYVNDYSSDLGTDGLAAVRHLFDRAEDQGIIPPCSLPLTLSG